MTTWLAMVVIVGSHLKLCMNQFWKKHIFYFLLFSFHQHSVNAAVKNKGATRHHSELCAGDPVQMTPWHESVFMNISHSSLFLSRSTFRDGKTLKQFHRAAPITKNLQSGSRKCSFHFIPLNSRSWWYIPTEPTEGQLCVLAVHLSGTCQNREVREHRAVTSYLPSDFLSDERWSSVKFDQRKAIRWRK